jgi:uncharacterized membrane protein (DUF106 family)
VLDLTPAGYQIALISVGVMLFSSVVRRTVLGKDKMKAHKEKMQFHNEKIKDAQKRKDFDAMSHHQKELMGITMEQMKPMFFTMIPLLLLFQWMGGIYGDIGAVHNATVLQAVPGGVEFSQGEPAHNSTYNASSRAMTWYLGRFAAQTGGVINVTLEAQNGFPQGFVMPPADVEYGIHNGSVERFSAKAGGAVTGYVLNVNVSEPKIEGNKAKYTISYSNSDSYRVVTVLGHDFGWLGWYILSGMVVSIIFNKIIN